jgi:hypothetical protein
MIWRAAATHGHGPNGSGWGGQYCSTGARDQHGLKLPLTSLERGRGQGVVGVAASHGQRATSRNANGTFGVGKHVKTNWSKHVVRSAVMSAVRPHQFLRLGVDAPHKRALCRYWCLVSQHWADMQHASFFFFSLFLISRVLSEDFSASTLQGSQLQRLRTAVSGCF